MGFREYVIVTSIIAFLAMAGFVVWSIISLRRNPEREEPRNIAEFLPDEDLEGRRLERVLGWALMFTLVIAVALPVYFVAEPFRQESMEDTYLEQSIARGETYFADPNSEAYVSDTSLQCARCHGADGKGGTASFVLQPESDVCLVEQNQGNPDVPECLPKQVSWSAPDLTLATLRYSRAQLMEIITYGRPGTPMPPWGVASGQGSETDQAITDIINYLESIQADPAKAKVAAEDAIQQYRDDTEQLVEDKQTALDEATAAVEAARADPSTDPDTLARLESELQTAQAEADNAIVINDEAQELSDGAILFRLNCARCHTKGWSYKVNEPTRPDLSPLPPQGSGAFGPNLTNGAELLQFPGEAGVQEQFDWVALGADENVQYGARGISSGRMPHFGRVLTEEQIQLIVEYERSL
jgi:mono/diheme cytochrome c family protein